MGPADVQEFIAMLEQAGELARVEALVDPHLEVAAIINAVSKTSGGGQALLFENVMGYKMPLAANLFGSRKRMAMALGVTESEELPKRLRGDLAATGARTSTLALQQVVSGRQYQAGYADQAACFTLDITHRGVNALPALQSWPADGGRYLTLGQVFTCHPETQVANCGMYRMQVAGRNRLLLRCHPGSGGGEHLSAWHARGEAMPVAIALGGPPVMTWLAGVSLPGNVAETDFAGYMTGQPVSMVRCQDDRLAVPASAEIVIEGHILPGEEMLEGPFGNHTGSYVPKLPAPVIRIDTISMRSDAIYPCTVVGPPPMENGHLAAMTERALLPLLQFDCPWVHDVHMPSAGIFHRAAMVAIMPDCLLSFDALCESLWASALLKSARLLILLDNDTSLRDFDDIYWRVVNAGDWSKTCHVDAHKVVVDARSPAGARRVKPEAEVVRKVRTRWAEYGLGSIRPPGE